MPSINLRLTEAEHDALRKWAFDGRRSLQREIIFRLFDGRVHSGAAVGQVAVSSSADDIREEEKAVHRAESSSRLERAVPDSHFRPDFK